MATDIAAITIPVNTSQVDAGIKKVSQLDSVLVNYERARQRGIITEQQYAASLQKVTAELNGFVADMNVATAEVDRFSNAIRDADANTLNNLGRGLGESQKGMARFGLAAQQSGYQVGDFFVQIASGTSPVVAFTQQFSQLAGFFGGPWGAVIGAAAAVVGALAVAMMNGGASAKAFEDAVKGVNDTLSKTKDIIKIVQGDFSSLIEDFGSIGENIKNLVTAEIDISIRQLSESAKTLRDELSAMYNGNAWLNISRAEDLANAFQLNTKNSRELTTALENLKNQDTLEGQLSAATELREKFVSMVGPVNQMTQTQFEYYIQLVETEKALTKVVEATEDISGNNKLMEDSAAKALNKYSMMRTVAGRVANEIERAARAAALLASIKIKGVDANGNTIFDPRNENYDPARAAQESGFGFVYGTTSPFQRDEKGDKKSGAGGGGSKETSIEALRGQYDSLMGSLDPLIQAQNKYNDSLAMLNEALAKNAITQEQFKAGLEAIKQQLKEAQDPLNSFKQKLEDALDPNKNYIKGLEALQSSLAEFLFNPFEVGLDGMILGFSRALQRMASEALAAGFLKMLVGGAFGATGSAGAGILSFLSPNANGNAFAGGNVIPFANGGVVGGPMTFPMGGGKTGLMGEAGPEAIMPLKRGQDGKLGVASQGAASNNIKIVNVLDGAVVGNYLNTPEGEEVIMNVMRRTGVA